MRGYQDIVEQERRDFEQRRAEPARPPAVPPHAPVASGGSGQSVQDKVLLAVLLGCLGGLFYFAFFH